MTDQELRTQLWDYVYGLMEPAEAAALEVRIKSDPRLARMYAETRLESDLLAGAARLEHAPIPLTTRVAPAAATTQRFRAVRSTSRAAWANWVAGLAAVLLIGLFAYGWRPQHSVVAVGPIDADGVNVQSFGFSAKQAGPIYAEISGPAKPQEGLSNSFVIQTRDAQNAPQPVELVGEVHDENGRKEYESQLKTDANGVATWNLPGPVIRGHRKLIIKAKDQAADLPPVTATLDVAADQYQAHLEVDREVSQPGETVFFRAVVLGENSRVESSPTDAEFELLDPMGNPVPGSKARDTTVHGVAAGEVVIPSNAPEGQYEVLVRSPQQEFEEQRIAVNVQRDGTIAAFGATTRPEALAARGVMPKLAMNENRAQDKFKRNNGPAVADSVNAAPATPSLEAKAFDKPQAAYAANTPAAKFAEAGDAPAPPSGAPAAPAPGNFAPAAPAAPAADFKSEAGAKELAKGGPAGGGAAHLETLEKKLREQTLDQARRGDANALGGRQTRKSGATPGGVGGNGAGAAFGGVPDALRGEKQKQGLARDSATVETETFAYDSDRRADQANPSRDRAGLIVELVDVPQSFAPGQDVSLGLKTKTETGEEVSAVLGLRVVNTEFLSDDAALAADGVQLSRLEAAKDAQWAEERRNARQSNSSQSGEPDRARPAAPREAAVDGLAQAKGDGSFANGALAERAPTGRSQATDRRAEYWDDMNATQVTLGSNRDLVRDRQEKFSQLREKDESSQDLPPAPTADDAIVVSTTDVRPLGRRLLVGGLLGLVAIGVLLVVRVPVRAWAWGPALVAASACLVLGIVRLTPPRQDVVAEVTTTGQAKNSLKRIARPEEETQPTNEPKPNAELRDETPGLAFAEEESLQREVRKLEEAEKAKQEPLTKQRLAEQTEHERAAKDGGDAAARKPASGPATATPADASDEKAQKAVEMQRDLADVKKRSGETMRRKAAETSPAVPPATLLWNPRLVTDEQGEARIKFRLPDQPGNYRLIVQGHADGRLGATEFVINTQPPVVAAPAEPAAKPAADEAASPSPATPAKPQPPVESKE